MENLQIFENGKFKRNTPILAALSKVSNSEDIKRYFLKVLELRKSGNEFPVSLDEVWLLCYEKR